ncbi:Peptidoglycan-binding LysM domain-containing protein, putative isoform 1 [Cinnamomum micranthum f. kanehirae]|uniref:Peptidoglycan-binding LysM domain-containing protein, putative isoform 1 n=1 Tax=Cinnamomum micranthum f. kanehirae TaxID=337451 RepID=A0A3S3PH24_9MAGN|nr:Peptidoglycan-binding LysM domain-containing protein, putative isoform 1 [Cinnamomum micranthum f. kanehirae]
MEQSMPSSGIHHHIEHRVSRMDTLPGIAIKYGVEVADIRRLNGLVTDLQMFAHNSLQIPLPGRHPPSSVTTAGGTEMAVYKKNRTPFSDPHPSQHPRSRSLANHCPLENGRLSAGGSETQKSNEKLCQRQKKTFADQAWGTSELLLKGERSIGFSGITAKSVALRPKLVGRADLSADMDLGVLNPFSMGNTTVSEGFSGFWKSSCTSTLKEPVNGPSLCSISNWTKRSDLKAMPTGSSTQPVFDGLPKPVAIRRNKAAMD